MDKQLINVGKLHEELEAAGLPVVSVHSDGLVDYSRALSKAEELKAEQLINNHDPVVIIPPTTDQLVRALWKKIMLGDSSDADNLSKLL